MEQQPTTPAPAPSPAPATVTASMDAATKGDFSAFREAAAPTHVGKPEARVEAPVVEPAAPPVETAPVVEPTPTSAPTLSKRQQQANDNIRTAVERATADLQAEIARLKATTPQAQTPPASAPLAVPDFKRIASLPDAPRMSDTQPDGSAVYDTLEEHAAAMALFVHRTVASEQQQTQAAQSIEQATTAQIDSFDARVSELAKSDPGIVDDILPLAQSLGADRGPGYIVSQLALASPVGPQALQFLKRNPAALAQLVAVPDHLKALPRALQVQQHVAFLTKEFGKLEARLEPASPPAPVAAIASPISAAPPPPPRADQRVGTTDPVKAAIERNDFGSARQHWHAERVAARRSA